MARILLVLLLVSSHWGAWASQDGEQSPTHLERFAKQMGSYTSLHATLKLAMINRQSQFEQLFDASLEMRGRAYCFITDELEVWSDGTCTWQYMPVVHEVTITDVDTTSMTLFDNVMRLFTEYTTLYKVAYKGIVEQLGKQHHLYYLYPKALGQPYSQIQILLTENAQRPASIYYKGKDGVDYRVEVLSFTPNAAVRKSFVFKAKGRQRVKEIDLRGQ